MKKPTASNSLDNLSSNFQSSIFNTISLSCTSSDPKRSIWLVALFSKIFFILTIKFGIELNNACLLLLILSKVPALTNPSNCSLLIFFGSTLFKKLLTDLNSPFLILSLTIFETASYPTLLIPPNA